MPTTREIRLVSSTQRPKVRRRWKTERRVVAGLCVTAAVAHPAAAQPPAPPTFPLTIQQAGRHATANYPSIPPSAARVRAQESGVDLTKTSYLPRLDSSLQI